MKIGILSDTYLPQINGVSTSIETFKNEFEKKGHEVVIIGPKVETTTPSTKDVWRFRSVPFPFQKEYRLILPISRKLRGFEEHNFDILHGQTPFTMGYLSLYLGKKYKIPIVHTYHTYFEKYMHYVPLLPKKMGIKYAKFESKKFYNRCDQIIVPSTQMKSALQAYQVNKPVDVIPTGIKTDRKVSVAEKTSFLKQWNLDPSKPILIFVGRLGQEKNISFLIDAFHKIKKSVDSQLLVIGDGPEKKWMEEKVTELGIEKSVKFTGYLKHEEIFIAYSSSDLILFPSKTETQGLSLLEGLSVGTPAVCINSMGVADILHQNRGGFLCQDSLDNYVQAAINLLSDSTLYSEKSNDAIIRSKEFSAEKMAEKMLSLYETVVKNYAKK
ncbi:glycosyltransferase family 4 protein [bacterium]|jgi:1,2-diacylglycerol 3-alpha-glucosyltransferase|nr:glycosyltransferase family 4 protein [bacterium]